MIYLDSSVLLAELFAEDRSPTAEFWQETLISSRLLEVEVWNRVHAYQRDRSHGEHVRALLGHVALMELEDAVLTRAMAAFPIAVRTLDALHLASIQVLRAQGELIELATYDKRLAAGASALGIVVATM